MVPYPRFLKATLQRDLRLSPVVVVMGARQVGKTTLCRDIASEEGLAYRTLDDRDTREQALEDPEGLLADHGVGGLALDEVQRVPGLLMAVKAVVDQEQRPGRYLLSGSNQPAVSGAVSESLRGRAAYRTLRPLTLSEQRYAEEHPGWSFLFGEGNDAVLREMRGRAEASGPLDWHEAVLTGGFPRALAAPPGFRQRLLNDYVETFARRDIREVLGIESVERFEAFFRLCSARTGQELNFSEMSRDLATPVNTLRRWADAIARSYLVERIPAWSRNSGERVIKSPKLFLVDAALAIAASRETKPSGFHLETLVATDLCSWRDQEPDRGLHHWRLGTGQEVDFILEEAGQLVAVEVKAATRVDGSDARHLHTFLAAHSVARRGLVLSNDPEIRDLGRGILASPWWGVL